MQVKNKKILYVKFYMLRIRGYCPHPAGAHSNHKGSSYHEWEGSLIFQFILPQLFSPCIKKIKNLSCLITVWPLSVCWSCVSGLRSPFLRCQPRPCRGPYRGRSRSYKLAAVLRLHRTQPKDRRVYTPLTGSSAWPEPTAERKKGLTGQEAWAWRWEKC